MTGDWEAATREGARRTQLRRALAMTVRQRLQALEDLVEASRTLAESCRAVEIRVDEQATSSLDDAQFDGSPSSEKPGLALGCDELDCSAPSASYRTCPRST